MNIKNNSPWLAELERTRPVEILQKNESADIAIIGGGIAGVMTLYYILKKTTSTIVLIEGDKVAHGATGHNAGQVVSYFERPLFDIVNEFGIEQSLNAVRSVESGWSLLDEMYQ